MAGGHPGDERGRLGGWGGWLKSVAKGEVKRKTGGRRMMPSMKSRFALFCSGIAVVCTLSCEQQSYEETKKFNQKSSLHRGDAAGHGEVKSAGHGEAAKPEAGH